MNLYNIFLNKWSEKWFQFVKDNPNKKWDYYELSENPNITWEIVQANPDKPWNYNQLSINPNVTWEIVQANPDEPWDYNWLSSNPNITWEIVQANLDKPWRYDYLSENKMDKPREEFIRKKFQGWFRRSDLKAELMANVWHPRNFEKFKYLDPETFGEEF